MIKTFLTAFFIAIVSIAPARAQDSAYYPIGKIVALEGQAYFITGDNRSRIHVDDPVYMNATLSTESGAKALIVFIDDTQITLAENSELVIDEFVFDPYEEEENEAEFQVSKGAFMWISGMISKGERPHVKIITNAGTIGIRGTQFWAGNVENGYGLFVDSGLVAFDGEWGKAEIPAGEGIFIAKEKPADTQKDFWSAERHAKAIERVTFGNDKDLDEKIKQRLKDNIRERHDYRGRMFPYKSNGGEGYTPDKDKFFTDEFNEMRDQQ